MPARPRADLRSCVEIHSPVFLELNKPQPIVLSELAEGLVTGDTPELGETRRVSP